MSISFNEEVSNQTRHTSYRKKYGVLTLLLIKSGLARNATEARNAMLIASAILIVATVTFVMFTQPEERVIDNTDPLTGQPMLIPK